MAEQKKYYAKTVRSVRAIRPYPRRPQPMVRNLRSTSAIERASWRQKRPRRHARPWQYRTRLDPDSALEERAADNVQGSLQERIVYKALIEHGLLPGIDFDFQSSMLGGRAQLGGLVADFVFPIPQVVLQVQSYWHLISLDNTQRDNDQAAILQSMGYTVLELWPVVIEDQAALDLWIERNIMQLWGTSRQNFGISHDRNYYFMLRDYDKLVALLRRLLIIVERLYGLRSIIDEHLPSGSTNRGGSGGTGVTFRQTRKDRTLPLQRSR